MSPPAIEPPPPPPIEPSSLPSAQEGAETTSEAGAQATSSSANASAMPISKESTITSSSSAAQPGSADPDVPSPSAQEGDKTTSEAGAQATSNLDAANQNSTVVESPDQAPQSKQVTEMTHKTPSSEPLPTNTSATPISKGSTTTSSSNAAQPGSADPDIPSLINQINSNDIKDDILQKACEFLTKHYDNNSSEINQLISALKDALAHMTKSQLKFVKDELKRILKQIGSNHPLFDFGMKLYEEGIYKNKVSRIFGQIESETYRHLRDVKAKLANSNETTTDAASGVAPGASDGSLKTESQKVAFINEILSKKKTQQAISKFINLSLKEKNLQRNRNKLLRKFPKETQFMEAGGLGFILVYNDIAFKIQLNTTHQNRVIQNEFQAPKQAFERLTKISKEQAFLENAENSIIRTIEQKDYGSFAVTFMEALPIKKDTDSKTSSNSDTTDTKKQLSDATRLNNFAQICHSVSLLHQAGLAHGDLKPENFAIIENSDFSSSSYSTKIFNFGEAHIIGGSDTVIDGTQFWSWGTYRENTDKNDSIALIRILIAEFIGQEMYYNPHEFIPQKKLETAPDALKKEFQNFTPPDKFKKILSGHDILIPEGEQGELEKQLLDRVNKNISETMPNWNHKDTHFLKSINNLYLGGEISEEKYRIAIQLLALNTDDPESRPSALQLMCIATALADYSDRKEKLEKTKEQLEKPNTLIPEESKEDFDVQSAFENAKELYPETMSLQIHHELVEAIESGDSEKIEASLEKILVHVSSNSSKSDASNRYGNTNLKNTPTYGLALLYACSKHKEFSGVELNENTIPNWVQENPQAALSLILRAKNDENSSFSGTEAPIDMPMDQSSFDLLLKSFQEKNKDLSPEKWKECITYLDSQMAIDETIKEFLKVELGCPEEILPKKVLPDKAFGAHAQLESPSQQTSTSSTQSPLSAPNQPASESPKSDETSIAASTP